jgi:hypothetical protein
MEFLGEKRDGIGIDWSRSSPGRDWQSRFTRDRAGAGIIREVAVHQSVEFNTSAGKLVESADATRTSGLACYSGSRISESYHFHLEQAFNDSAICQESLAIW